MAVTLVQSNGTSRSGAGSYSTTISAVTAGNTVLVWLSATGTNPLSSYGTPSASGMTFSLLYQTNINADTSMGLFIAENVSGGATSVSATSSDTATYMMIVAEVSGTCVGRFYTTKQDAATSASVALPTVPVIGSGSFRLGAWVSGRTVSSGPTSYTLEETFSNTRLYSRAFSSSTSDAPTVTYTSSAGGAIAIGIHFLAGRILYPDSSTNNALSYGAFTAEKNASWDDAPHSSNVAFTNIAKDASVDVTWFASDTPAHNSPTFPTASASVSVDVTSATSIAAGNSSVWWRRATLAGGTGPTGFFQSSMDLSTTGIKTSGVGGSTINSGTTAVDDTLYLYIGVIQSGSHTLGAITIDDSDTYIYHPDLVKPSSSSYPPKPRTIPGVAVSQSSRW